MKTLVAVMLFVSTASLWAQGTLYLSNLGESGGDLSVQGGKQSFETGTASNGYMLNSITLLMGPWQGYASNFSVSIYNDNNGQAGVLISALDGNSDPETAGQYVYTATGIFLNSTTPYWIVATCDRSPSSPPFPLVGYSWQVTSSTNFVSADRWSVGSAVVNTPIPVGDNSPRLLQFALNATQVPEPSVFALGGLALGLARVARRSRSLVR
jgi:hypothetical protein